VGQEQGNHRFGGIVIPYRAHAPVPAILTHGAFGESRRVTTPTPNPHPLASKSSGKNPDTAFCAGVSWSVVIVSTEAARATAPHLVASSRRRRGSHSPWTPARHPLRECGHDAPLSRRFVVDAEFTCREIGAVARDESMHVVDRREEARVLHAQRLKYPLAEKPGERHPGGASDEYPKTSAPVWYSHRSPGWHMRGSVDNRRIHSFDSGAIDGCGGPTLSAKGDAASLTGHGPK